MLSLVMVVVKGSLEQRVPYVSVGSTSFGYGSGWGIGSCRGQEKVGTDNHL